MKTIIIAAWIGLVIVAADIRADEASKRARIEELLLLTNVEAVTNQVLDQIKNMSLESLKRAGMPGESEAAFKANQERIFALIKDQMSWEKMKPNYVQLYSDAFTEEEVEGIVAFYKTPTGQGMLKKMPMLMQNSMKLSQQRMAEIMPEIQRIIQETKQETKDKQQKQPPAK